MIFKNIRIIQERRLWEGETQSVVGIWGSKLAVMGILGSKLVVNGDFGEKMAIIGVCGSNPLLKKVIGTKMRRLSVWATPFPLYEGGEGGLTEAEICPIF